MRLAKLIEGLPVSSIVGATDLDINLLTYDSRKIVDAHSLFVAIPGEHVDGNVFIKDAIALGASVITSKPVNDNGSKAPYLGTIVTVDDAREALAKLAANFFENPSFSLKIIGVTGTNGKTTTAFLTKHICMRTGFRCGFIGTIHYDIGDGITIDSKRTTPEALELQSLLARMRDNGTTAASVEVSSHAISQKRVNDMEFDVAIFTNLTQDHLDYHHNLGNYFEAKSKLFTNNLAKQKVKKGVSIINIDDIFGRKLLSQLSKGEKVLTFGQDEQADFHIGAISTQINGTSFLLHYKGKKYSVRFPLAGKFNVYNAVAAIAGSISIGIDAEKAIDALATAESPPGRLQMVETKNGISVFVDYAHTEDALTYTLITSRTIATRRIILVFGCGGNRDKTKRPKMGKVAEKLSDYVIVTSDNPRDEDPLAIALEITSGMNSSSPRIILDRKDAIAHALEVAQPGDLILIAGKGHECYQEFASETISFDDARIVRELLRHTS